MSQTDIKFQAQSTGADLSLLVYFDHKMHARATIDLAPRVLQLEFDDSDGVHLFELELIGKLPQHTLVDDNGEIVLDRVVKIDQLSIAGIEITQLFFQKSLYTHDFNGTGKTVRERFFGVMGCNGRVKFQFSSPVYLWLLENL